MAKASPTRRSEPWSERGVAYAASAPHRHGPSLPRLIALARPGSADVCLDIGTGAGHTAAQLALTARRVIGLDPAEGMRRAAQATYGHVANLEFVDGLGDETGLPGDTFDIVTARHTLHHHASVPATLAEIRRVLKPGGRLVIVDEITPDPRLDDWYNRLEQVRDPTHRRAYTMGEWRRFLAEAGLERVVRDAETRYTIDVDDWLARMDPNPEQEARVRSMLAEAGERARNAFGIVYRDGRALSFSMPMALILALKPQTAEPNIGVTP